MHFNVTIGSKRYRIQFRKAVLCQLFTEEGKQGLVLRHQTTAIHNPIDRYSFAQGVHTAYSRMLKVLPLDRAERGTFWGLLFRRAMKGERNFIFRTLRRLILAPKANGRPHSRVPAAAVRRPSAITARKG